mgnify:FL=1
MIFKKRLNSSLDECLFIRVAMVFFFAILQRLALLVPVKLKVDIFGSCCDWQLCVDQFDNRLLDVVVFNSSKIGVQTEILGHNPE